MGAPPSPGCQHRQHHGHPGGVKAGDGAPGIFRLGGNHEGLNLGDNGSHPIHGDGDRGAVRGGIPVGQKQAGRVGYLFNAIGLLFETPNLVGGTKPVFNAAQHAQTRVPVALKIQHHINQVFEHSGAGNIPVLGDVPHQQHGDAGGFRQGGEGRGHRPGLGDATGNPFHIGGVHGLD